MAQDPITPEAEMAAPAQDAVASDAPLKPTENVTSAPVSDTELEASDTVAAAVVKTPAPVSESKTEKTVAVEDKPAPVAAKAEPAEMPKAAAKPAPARKKAPAKPRAAARRPAKAAAQPAAAAADVGAASKTAAVKSDFAGCLAIPSFDFSAMFKPQAALTDAIIEQNIEMLDFVKNRYNQECDTLEALCATRSPMEAMPIMTDFWHSAVSDYTAQAEKFTSALMGMTEKSVNAAL
ncbi:hypothetical protein BFP70_02795 [Thioclava sp. SK-1]|uniref:hypothetical protein n=1 Tax=Thioclava sp. SK-1 TaxID=1889770 RepID=UPI0008256928|nr:hypothetical protein [Thioclava sp. SK-1]OCX67107.1 hypothetical protein BFP70_02795 [Thioclava sp. SK-1]